MGVIIISRGKGQTLYTKSILESEVHGINKLKPGSLIKMIQMKYCVIG